MSANKFTESLTRENAAVVFVDRQVGLCSGVRDIALAELKHNVVALAKAARVFKLPLVVTTTAARSMWGPTIPELASRTSARPRRLARPGFLSWRARVFRRSAARRRTLGNRSPPSSRAFVPRECGEGF